MSLHHDIEEHEDGATRTLNAIRTGGQKVIAQTRRRLSTVLDDLDKGDFREAHQHLLEAAQWVSPLSAAQSFMAIAEDSVMLPAGELRTGMVLTDVGEITDIEVHECGAVRCTGHVKIKIGTHELDYGGDVELYVESASV